MSVRYGSGLAGLREFGPASRLPGFIEQILGADEQILGPDQSD